MSSETGMRETSATFKMQLGSFDLIKGIAMIAIVAWHSFSFDRLLNIDVPLAFKYCFIFVLNLIISAVMPAFFVMTGYGFRANMPTRKLIKQLQYYLKPYLLTGVATVIVHFVAHYSAFGYLRGAVTETLKVAAGVLLALPKGREINGVWIFWCGAIWYFMAAAIGWCVLHLCIKFVKEKWVPAVVIFIATAGWLISINRVTFFCFSQGLVAAFFFYIGYLSREKKILIEKPKTGSLIALCASALVTTVGLVIFKDFESMADNVWYFGTISIIADGVLGIALLYFFVRLGSSKNFIARLIKTIGRNSLHILCVHSVGMLAVPWYLIQEKIGLGEFQNNLIVFVLRAVLIFISVYIIIGVKKFLKRIRRSRNRK